MCTLGCRGNCGRPHKRAGEQKTQRPSSSEEWKEKGRDGEKIKFHFSLGGYGVYAERKNKYQEAVEGNEVGGMDG